jgi:hypothetical protein
MLIFLQGLLLMHSLIKFVIDYNLPFLIWGDFEKGLELGNVSWAFSPSNLCLHILAGYFEILFIWFII